MCFQLKGFMRTFADIQLKFKIVILISAVLLISYHYLQYPILFYLFVNTNQHRLNAPKVLQKYQTQLILSSKCECRHETTIRVTKMIDEYLIENGNKSKYYMNSDEYSLGLHTCDLYNVLRRGPNQKVIGLSLYGNKPLYYNHIKAFAQQAHQYYPGWIIRIHYDHTINTSVICDYECMAEDNIDFCDVNRIPYGSAKETWNANYMHKMSWRWLPIGDPYVDFFMSRDSDSSIIQREVDSTNVWLNSNTLFHVMRDHPAHGVVILGGMWSLAKSRNPVLTNEIYSIIVNHRIAKMYNNNNNSRKGLDQDFLADYVWLQARKNATVHDSYHCKYFGYSKPFPTRRGESLCFVACTIPKCCNKDVFSIKNHVCPIECRPKDHQDWIYC